jgi:hypothetical protein
MAIEMWGGGGCSLCRQERECHFFAEYQELLGVVLEFCEKFCGSGESSLVPNTYPKSFFHAKVEKGEPPGFHYKKSEPPFRRWKWPDSPHFFSIFAGNQQSWFCEDWKKSGLTLLKSFV